MSREATTKSNAPIIALLVIIIVALGIAAFFVGRDIGGGENTAKNTAETTDTSRDNAANIDTNNLAAPRVNDEQSRKIIASLAKRDPKDPMSIGDADAPVVMIEFSDFSCPRCSQYEAETAPELQKYVENGTLRIEYHDFTIFASDYHSDLAARAAWAAGQQGKFWEFKVAGQAKSLTEHANWNDALVRQVAKEAGVTDLKKFDSDRQSQEATKHVTDNTQLAANLGFPGTPAFLVNDRPINGQLPTATFIATIEAAAADAK